MNKLIVMMMVVAGSLAAQTNYSGIWEGKGVIQSARYPGGVPMKVEMTLLQSGTALQGTVKTSNIKPYTITTGTVSGNSLSIVTTSNKATQTIQLTATSPTTMSGSVTTSTGEVYQLSLVKH